MSDLLLSMEGSVEGSWDSAEQGLERSMQSGAAAARYVCSATLRGHCEVLKALTCPAIRMKLFRSKHLRIPLREVCLVTC